MTPALLEAIQQALNTMKDLHASVLVDEVSWCVNIGKQIKHLENAMNAEPVAVHAGFFKKNAHSNFWLQYAHDYPFPNTTTELFEMRSTLE